MPTNKIAADKTRITLQLSHKEKEQLEELAAKSNMGLSEYVRSILGPALKKRAVIHKEIYVTEEPEEYNSSKKSLPADAKHGQHEKA